MGLTPSTLAHAQKPFLLIADRDESGHGLQTRSLGAKSLTVVSAWERDVQPAVNSDSLRCPEAYIPR